MMTDPIADMLARIRNAAAARHAEVRCPTSKIRRAVAEVLSRGGFLGEVRVEEGEGHPSLVMQVLYRDDGRPMIDAIRRVSRPGRRVYVGADEIPQVRKGLGMMVVSTSSGVLSDGDAREKHVGGELLCEVW
jgi:small subunit ribosomal protein S8